jgi:hypothetical protein
MESVKNAAYPMDELIVILCAALTVRLEVELWKPQCVVFSFWHLGAVV